MKFELNVVRFDANDVVTSSAACANPVPAIIGGDLPMSCTGVL